MLQIPVTFFRQPLGKKMVLLRQLWNSTIGISLFGFLQPFFAQSDAVGDGAAGPKWLLETEHDIVVSAAVGVAFQARCREALPLGAFNISGGRLPGGDFREHRRVGTSSFRHECPSVRLTKKNDGN